MNKILSDIEQHYLELVRIAGYYTPNSYEAYELVHYTIDYMIFVLKPESKEKIIENNNTIPYFIKLIQSFSENSKYTNIVSPNRKTKIVDYDIMFDTMSEEYDDEIECYKDDKKNELINIIKKVLTQLVEDNHISLWKKNLFESYYFDNNIDQLMVKYRLSDVIVNKTRSEIEALLLKTFKKEL